MKRPFPVNPVLMAIAIAFQNAKYIADFILPREPVGKSSFEYLKHTLAEGFTIPDTRVGRRSKPNEVEFTATEESASTSDYGLDDPVPQSDIDDAPEGYDPLGRATEGLTDLIALDREKRTADLVFNASSYGSNNKVTLSGNDQFSDFTNSDPVERITDCLDSMIMRANIMVIGRPAFSVLTRHPMILKAVHGNSGDAGIARKQDIAELFELDDIHVGEAWYNTSKKGQTLSLSRLWGKHISLIYQSPRGGLKRGVTFGLTAQFGSRVAGSWHDKNIGLKGGEMVRVGESVKELILANDVGYFIQNAVA